MLIRSLLLFIFVSLLLSPQLSSAVDVLDGPDILIYQNDVFAVSIWPVVEEFTARCNPLDSGALYDLFLSQNRSGYSVVWISPGAEGTYNFTVSFTIGTYWNYTIGVYTDDYHLYNPNLTVEPSLGGYFVTIRETHQQLAGNYTLIFTLHVKGRSPGFFFIKLPSSINGVVFFVATAFIGYLNAFFLLDTYFKSKMAEGISRKRLFLSVLLVALSILLIYEMYIFTTFTPPWSV